MIPDGSRDWRDANVYRRLVGIDRAGLMWEWLRRDPAYISWYERASTATHGVQQTGLLERPLQWGIHFCGGPGTHRG